MTFQAAAILQIAADATMRNAQAVDRMACNVVKATERNLTTDIAEDYPPIYSA